MKASGKIYVISREEGVFKCLPLITVGGGGGGGWALIADDYEGGRVVKIAKN